MSFWTPEEDHVGVVDEGDDEDDKKDKEVADNFSRANGESAGHCCVRRKEERRDGGRGIFKLINLNEAYYILFYLEHFYHHRE